MAFDYDEAKRFFVNKLATDLEGKGRMESALYHTAKMIYEAGARDTDAAKDAQIAELETKQYPDYGMANWYDCAMRERDDARKERDALLEKLCAIGVIGDGYCFCSRDRDPGKHEHQPECAEARQVIALVQRQLHEKYDADA